MNTEYIAASKAEYTAIMGHAPACNVSQGFLIAITNAYKQAPTVELKASLKSLEEASDLAIKLNIS